MKCSCTSNARTHLMLVLLEDESRIVPTEAERVRNGHIHVVLERFVADDDVRIHFRIQIADVTVRVQDTSLFIPAYVCLAVVSDWQFHVRASVV